MSTARRWLAAIGALGLLLGGAGCDFRHHRHGHGPDDVVGGSGVLVTEARDVAGFSSVSVEGGARLMVERTGVESLTVTADDNILPYLESRVVGDRLVLGPRPGVGLSPTREVVYRVTCRDMVAVFASGATHAELTGIDTDGFVADASGASVVVASGRVSGQAVQLSGASEYRAADLVSRTAVVGLSGASRATVRVSDRLVVTASGASLLEYIGSPAVTQSTSGGSRVTQIER